MDSNKEGQDQPVKNVESKAILPVIACVVVAFILLSIAFQFSTAYNRIAKLEEQVYALIQVRDADWYTLCSPAAIRCVGRTMEYSSMQSAVADMEPGDVIMLFGGNSAPEKAFKIEALPKEHK